MDQTSTLKTNVGVRVRQLVDSIPERVILRYMKEFEVERPEAERHYEETVKYLLGCSEIVMPLVPSLVVDDAWHNFILFTKDYAPWCEAHLGAVVHHVPTVEEEEGENADGSMYETTVEFLAERYGIDRAYWPTCDAQCSKCSKCGNCSKCSQCSNNCKSSCKSN